MEKEIKKMYQHMTKKNLSTSKLNAYARAMCMYIDDDMKEDVADIMYTAWLSSTVSMDKLEAKFIQILVIDKNEDVINAIKSGSYSASDLIAECGG